MRPEEVNAYLQAVNTSEIAQPVKLDTLMRRPQVDITKMAEIMNILSELTQDELDEVGNQIKYEQYVARQNQQNAHFEHLERIRIPENVRYQEIHGLSSEAIEKLSKLRPENLSAASRISGVSPSDVSIILTWLKAGGYHG